MSTGRLCVRYICVQPVYIEAYVYINRANIVITASQLGRKSCIPLHESSSVIIPLRLSCWTRFNALLNRREWA